MNNKSFDTKRIAMGYAKRPWLHKNVILKLAENIGSSFQNGLDVGCGAGLSTKALRLIAKKVTGTDISEDMISVCHELYKEDDSYEFYVAKAEETKQVDADYDIVTAAGVINWVDKEAFLDNVKSVMAKDGKLVIYDFWITNMMKENSAYTSWYDNEYLIKFPKPRRNEDVWTSKDMPENMNMKYQKEYDVTYDFSLEEFIDFMMIQSNVNVKIANKEITEADARAWFQKSLNNIFINVKEELIFHGYYWLIENQV